MDKNFGMRCFLRCKVHNPVSVIDSMHQLRSTTVSTDAWWKCTESPLFMPIQPLSRRKEAFREAGFPKEQ